MNPFRMQFSSILVSTDPVNLRRQRVRSVLDPTHRTRRDDRCDGDVGSAGFDRFHQRTVRTGRNEAGRWHVDRIKGQD